MESGMTGYYRKTQPKTQETLEMLSRRHKIYVTFYISNIQHRLASDNLLFTLPTRRSEAELR
jgi:hypothetical protein